MEVSTVKPGSIIKVQYPSWYTKNSPKIVDLYEVKTIYNGVIYGIPLRSIGDIEYDKMGNRTIRYPDNKFEVIA